MNLPIPIEQIQAGIRRNTLVIESERPLRTLSSAVLNGGFRDAAVIVNHQVPKSYEHADLEAYLRDVVEALGFRSEKVVGLMTAADVQDVAIVTKTSRNLIVCALVTAGLSYPATAGDAIAIEGRQSSTINIILLVDGNLSESCMVDAVGTATEAKAVALRELKVKSHYSGEIASGTTTDALVIACTGRGDTLKYAGTATELGQLTGGSVREAVKAAVRKGKVSNLNR